MTDITTWRDDLPLSPELPPYPAAEAALEAPHERLALTPHADAPATAALALWLPDGLRDPHSRPVARIGRFSAVDEASATALLGEALVRLAEAGATRVVGPMNGSTWHAYRLADAAPDDAPFPGEPPFLPALTAAFAAQGFSACERYVSVETERLGDAETAALTAERAGVAVTTVTPASFDEAMDAIWRIAGEAFARAPYFTPIARASFDAVFAPARLAVHAGATTLAHIDGEPAGFMFAYPWRDALIAKTIAVAPEAEGRGVGLALTQRTLADAARLGLARTVFGTMHDSNFSAQWSSGRGRVCARYTLFGREL